MDSSRACTVVVADDFGKSSSVNRAVAEAHEKGIVTAASIMAGGDAFDDAVRIARSRPGLSLGLHLTLCDGKAVLTRSKVPDLIDDAGRFEQSAARAWIRYSRSNLAPQIEKEIEAQFDRLDRAGIRPSHVDGHHHLHMHPRLFPVVCRHASLRGVGWVRIPREPLSLVLARTGRGVLPLIEWAVFRRLGVSHKEKLQLHGLQAAGSVYGLSQTGRLDEDYLLKIFRCIRNSRASRAGDTGVVEIFSHPDSETTAGRRELEALTALRIRAMMAAEGMKLLGYRELSERVLPVVPAGRG